MALGSNLGDPRRTLSECFLQLQAFSAERLARSSLYETDPVDCPPGSPPFLNAVAGLVPIAGETPESLLARLLQLEKAFGRQPKKILNESRPLDLDLIAFGNQVRATPTLILPHPRAAERRFVLEPLAEIAPGLILPGQTHSICQLLAALPPEPRVRRL